MSNKVVDLTIRLKDGVSGRLGKMKAGLSKFGAGMKKVAIAGVAMAGAIGVALGKMAKTFAAQQDAQVALASALDQVGLSGQTLLPIFQEYATGIQRVTKYGDEGILSAMAYGKNLGINTNQLKDATTAAIGLASKYKIDLQTAMMLVGRASQGQTQMLTRYGIVLDETLSPQEKFNEVLKIGAGAFSLATAETQSASGAWQQFKNAIGDAQETIIAAMTDGEDLIGVLKGMTDAVARLIDEGDISFWANDIKVAFDSLMPVFNGIQNFFKAVAAGTRTVGGFIGGFAGELSTGGNVADAFKTGASSGASAQQDYLDRRDAFKKAYQDERAEKVRLAEEVADVELEAKKADIRVIKEEEKKAFEEVADVELASKKAGIQVVKEEEKKAFGEVAETFGDKVEQRLEEAGGTFGDTLEESLPEITLGQVASGISGSSAPPSYGGGSTVNMGSANDLFGSLTGRSLEGGGGLTTTQALEEIKNLLGNNPEDIAKAMKTAMQDVYSTDLMVRDNMLNEVLNKTNDYLADLYALQQERLGGVLN